MNRKLLAITLAVLLALLLGVGGATGQEPEGEVRPQGEISIAAMVNSRISYQGILKEGGSPVTGERDMTFRLYSNSTCSTQVGDSIAMPGVTVTGGLFSLKLDVDQDDFNGQGLWLGVDVGNTGANVVCEEILPAPYALSLRPGAEIVGDLGDGAVIYAANTSTADDSEGIYGRSDSTIGGRGVYGWTSASSGINSGVYGQSDSTEGRGVYGWASATSGTTYGVYGRSSSNFGYGGFFINDGGGDLLAGNDNAFTTSDLEFRVANDGSVYSDNAFYCRWNYTGTGTGGAIREADLEDAPCLVDSTDADFAEMMPADEGLEPGDVLVIAPDGRLVRSDILYATNVAGVYSTRPSYVGGGQHVGEPGYVPLAMMGLVPVKASAENGPIAPGGLLVVSSTPGHAMRAGPNPPVGTVVGKALGSLDSGTGLIKMLVMLQ